MIGRAFGHASTSRRQWSQHHEGGAGYPELASRIRTDPLRDLIARSAGKTIATARIDRPALGPPLPLLAMRPAQTFFATHAGELSLDH
jgi:hypothetical protein